MSVLANGSRAFAHRNYRLFFFGQLISLIGTWMQQVAQAWLVLQLTGDPFLLGLVAAMQFLPVMVLGLFGGLIADALPKRPTLIATQVVQMILAFVLFGLTATGAVEVWQILVLALLLGITNAVDMPTRQSFVVEMVGREDVANAVALNSAVFNGARIVGPAIAGLTIGAFDISVAFLLNGISFIAVLVGYGMMRDEELDSPPVLDRPRTVRAVGRTLADGIRYVRRTDLVLLATVTVGLVSLFGMNFGVIIPALARDVLHTDATGYGFLMAASGIGSLIAALSIAFSAPLQARDDRPWRAHPGPGRDRGSRHPRLSPGAAGDGVRGLRGDRHGGDGEHGDPAGGAGRIAWPGDERLHHRVRRLLADRGPADGLDRVPVRGGGLAGRRWGRVRAARADRFLVAAPDPGPARASRGEGPDRSRLMPAV